ncbi:MAG TPA: DUF433 domain-containing protein [Lacipirellulaceae bacterium]
MITRYSDVITSDAQILGGAPVFAGTRVPVESLVAHLKAGDTVDTFLDDFPSVSREQVEAFLDLTAKMILEDGGNAHSS